MHPRIESALAKPNATIKEIMALIQAQPHATPPGPGHLALIVNPAKKLIGVVTDGDIRRAILEGKKLEDPISKIMKAPITFSAELSPDEILSQTIEVIKEKKLPGQRLEFIIITDKHGRPEDVFTFFELWQKAEIKTRVFAVVGLGYVGLTLSLALSQAGYKVIGIDTRKSVVSGLKAAKTHVHEKGVVPLLRKHLGKNFIVQNEFNNNVNDVYIICVGTPLNKNGGADTGPLEKALAKITWKLKHGDLVILRSTVPVGTCRNFVVPRLEKDSGLVAGRDFFVSFAPERTVEGNALEELATLPQIIGGLNQKSLQLTMKIFENITSNIVLVDSLETAEMIKLLNNTYRDLTFGFANEVAMLCAKLGLNSHKVIRAANQGYARSAIPLPSPGVGGPCLTKDPYILQESAKRFGSKSLLPAASRKINEAMIDEIASDIEKFLIKNRQSPKNAKIFIAGLAFKGEPETGDLRQSSALEIALVLKKKFPRLCVFDPVAARAEIKGLGLLSVKPEAGFKQAAAALVLTNHKSFLEWDIQKLARSMDKPGLVYDAWHLFEGGLQKNIPGLTYRTL